MLHNAFEQENIAAMTELNDEEITNLVGGTYGYYYDGDIVDIGDINIGNDSNINVLSIAQNNIIAGLLGFASGLVKY